MNLEEFGLHERALLASREYRRSEAELLHALMMIDQEKIFRKLGRRSLFQYCVEDLQLSEGLAYGLIQVARKSFEVPELLEAVADEVLSLSKAHKLASVVDSESVLEWIKFGSEHSAREIEFEVAKVNPKSRESTRVKPLSEDLVEVRLTVVRRTLEKFERVAALNGSNLEDGFAAMCDCYLYYKDPVAEANRVKTDRKTVHVNSVTAQTKHELFRRTQGRCTFIDKQGRRCNSDRHIEIHHIRPRSRGGGDEIENLTTLCSFHHSQIHGPYH